MVRFITSLIVLLILNSCCFRGSHSNYGVQRTGSVDRFFKNRNITIKDTLVLYDQIKTCFNGDCYAPDTLSHGKTYLRFYPNGKVSSFINLGLNKNRNNLTKGYLLKREDFNPGKSRMGYYYQKDDKAYISLFVINQCAAEWYKGELTFKNDYLVVKNLKKNISDSVIYKVKKVPPDLLTGWKPDW